MGYGKLTIAILVPAADNPLRDSAGVSPYKRVMAQYFFTMEIQ